MSLSSTCAVRDILYRGSFSNHSEVFLLGCEVQEQTKMVQRCEGKCLMDIYMEKRCTCVMLPVMLTLSGVSGYTSIWCVAWSRHRTLCHKRETCCGQIQACLLFLRPRLFSQMGPWLTLSHKPNKIGVCLYGSCKGPHTDFFLYPKSIFVCTHTGPGLFLTRNNILLMNCQHMHACPTHTVQLESEKKTSGRNIKWLSHILVTHRVISF